MRSRERALTAAHMCPQTKKELALLRSQIEVLQKENAELKVRAPADVAAACVCVCV